MNISAPFINRPIATTLLMAAFTFAGFAAYFYLPVAPLPQVDFPTIQVSAQLPGASAETMASSVANPLEQQFGQISGVTQLTSTSTLGNTQVNIQFELDRNIDAAAQDVQAAITAAGQAAAGHVEFAAKLPEVQPRRSADYPPGGNFGYGATHRC